MVITGDVAPVVVVMGAPFSILRPAGGGGTVLTTMLKDSGSYPSLLVAVRDDVKGPSV
jgi:hypothetical protein